MNFPWKITSAGENADLDLAQSMLSKSLATRRQTDMILKGIRALGGNKDQIVIERIGPTGSFFVSARGRQGIWSFRVGANGKLFAPNLSPFKEQA